MYDMGHRLVAPEDAAQVARRQENAMLWSVDVDFNELGRRWVTERCLQKSDTLLVFERSLQSDVKADLEGTRAGRGRPVRQRHEGRLGSRVSENSKDGRRKLQSSRREDF